MPQCAYIRDYMITQRVPSALTVRSNQKLTTVTRQVKDSEEEIPELGSKIPPFFFFREREELQLLVVGKSTSFSENCGRCIYVRYLYTHTCRYAQEEEEKGLAPKKKNYTVYYSKGLG